MDALSISIDCLMDLLDKSCFAPLHEAQMGDERILGDGSFVQEVPAEAEDGFERRYALKKGGL